jgi:hypothetical protein
MEVETIILGAFVLLLVIVVICLGNKYNQVKETLREVELDLQEYVRQAHNDARTINELKTYITTLEMELDNTKTE